MTSALNRNCPLVERIREKEQRLVPTAHAFGRHGGASAIIPRSRAEATAGRAETEAGRDAGQLAGGAGHLGRSRSRDPGPLRTQPWPDQAGPRSDQRTTLR